jgi:hypothetical protein
LEVMVANVYVNRTVQSVVEGSFQETPHLTPRQ